MLKLENEYAAGFQNAIRGMRFPMQSNDFSDSTASVVGFDDAKLAKHLATCGTDHGKFMRQIMVWVDITAPLYWFKEMDQYKVGTTTNSESTMHKLMEHKFTFDDFAYDDTLDSVSYELMLSDVINQLNSWRMSYINNMKAGNKDKAKKYWRMCVQLLPSCYLQKRAWSANYAVLRNIYHARKNHQLTEWHDFCRWIEDLPYSEWITAE